MDIVYVDKCRYEIQEPKEVIVSYTGIYRPISSTDFSHSYCNLNQHVPSYLDFLYQEDL
jgi:hypothetical protein